jgi:hypothetical protein
VSETLKPITRPNGKVYRPRKGLRQVGWWNDDTYATYVAVLGTHDIDKAREFARPYGSPHLVEPEQTWVRKMIQNGDEMVFVYDDRRGAACVVFRESDDPAMEREWGAGQTPPNETEDRA